MSDGSPSSSDGKIPLLKVEGLTQDFATVDGRVRVLQNISMQIERGEIVGIVGESGSGKSTLGLAIIGLLDSPPSEILSGSILFDGRDMLKLDAGGLSHFRGPGIGMVFQESLAALNPVYKTESQLKESIEVLRKAQRLELTDSAERDMMLEILSDLRLDKPEVVLKKYPHELSGGMRQRISIAMAIIEKPRLLILDEVTTGLDVYVQNRILGLLKELNRRTGTTMILITHDLTVASQICNTLYVMYAGRLMEEGRTEDLIKAPQHPYSQKLMAAIPQGFADAPALPAPTGEAPDIRKLPSGCKFHPRCHMVMEKCKTEEPPYIETSPGRRSSCWLAQKT